MGRISLHPPRIYVSEFDSCIHAYNIHLGHETVSFELQSGQFAFQRGYHLVVAHRTIIGVHHLQTKSVRYKRETEHSRKKYGGSIRYTSFMHKRTNRTAYARVSIQRYTRRKVIQNNAFSTGATVRISKLPSIDCLESRTLFSSNLTPPRFSIRTYRANMHILSECLFIIIIYLYTLCFFLRYPCPLLLFY